MALSGAGVVTSFRGPGDHTIGLVQALVGSSLTDIDASWHGHLEDARARCVIADAGPTFVSFAPQHSISGELYALDDEGTVVVILFAPSSGARRDAAARMTDLGRWTRAFVHMLNNSLFGILGYAEFGLTHNNLAATTNALTKIQIAGRRLRDRGSTLLDYGRALDLPSGESHCTSTQAIQAAIDLVEAVGRDTQRLSLEVPHHDAAIAAPCTAIAQILANLIENGLDSLLKHDDVVTLAVRISDEAIDLVVQDTGSGMTPNMLKRACLPFVTTKASSHSAHTTAGMGLTLAVRMAQEIRCTLNLQSEHGKGTTARLRCPVYREHVGANGTQTP
jgi:signal transduction histidine kinase